MANPYGGSGSIVVVPAQVLASSRRLGSRGWRLHDTRNGRKPRVSNPRLADQPVLVHTLTEDEQIRRALALTSNLINHSINVHDK